MQSKDELINIKWIYIYIYKQKEKTTMSALWFIYLNLQYFYEIPKKILNIMGRSPSFVSSMLQSFS